MSHLKSRRGVVSCLAVMLMSGAALTHAADSTRIFVPDEGNNRVLIYNHPTKSGQRADSVLGQSGFTTATSGTSSTAMSRPAAFALDAAGNLYVSDTGNCRVLQFLQPFIDGQSASVVIGKPDADTPCGSLTASQTNLGSTGGLAFDKSGALWVADAGNNRVLRFPAPFSTGQEADLVIGQPDFLSTSCPTTPTAASLCQPEGVAIGTDKMLWVADSSDHRVLGYKPAFTPGMSAIVELGHPAATAFTSNLSNDGGVSASSLFGPTGIAVDPANRLWVADGWNNRILRFSPKYKNGEAATVVLGQHDFMQMSQNQNGPASAATLNQPQGIFIRNSGDIWIGDTTNNRTLRYTSTFRNNDTPASLVLGQPDFFSILSNQGGANPSDKTQNAPFNAGPSIIALAVLGGLAGGRRWMQRFKQRG